MYEPAVALKWLWVDGACRMCGVFTCLGAERVLSEQGGSRQAGLAVLVFFSIVGMLSGCQLQ